MKTTIVFLFAIVAAVSAQWHGAVGHGGSIGHLGGAGHLGGIGLASGQWGGHKAGRSILAPVHGVGHGGVVGLHGGVVGLGHHRWGRSIVLGQPIAWGTGLHGIGHGGLIAGHHGLLI